MFFNLLTTSFNFNLCPSNICLLKNKTILCVESSVPTFSNLKIKNPKINQFMLNLVNNEFATFDQYNFIFYSFLFYNKKSLIKYTKHYTHFYTYFWCKITFRGKGFRVRKFFKAKKLTLNFGKSHWTKIKFDPNYSHIFKIRRQNYIFITPFFVNFFYFMYQLRIIKKINWYTKRGLRLKKQKIKKRFGKISQMVSSLHF